MTDKQNSLLLNIRNEVRLIFEGEGSGHDWWHIYRVTKTAKSIAIKESANLFIVEISALLHDVGDHKLFKEENAQEVLISKILKKYSSSQELIDQVLEIVKGVSFKGANVTTNAISLEGKIVQDADRLDAIGAIGIARAFAFGGHHNRLLYNPEEKVELHNNFENYKNSKSNTINHFHEKLLLLKDRMQTDTGKEIAQERHQYMESFLAQFYKEWEGTIN
jgi:uncharacterized protein